METMDFSNAMVDDSLEPDAVATGSNRPHDMPEESPALTARAYQLEMYERSLRQNVIVAMDTGTGKTHVAVLRIKAELDRSPLPKIVWFLAPTVLLCQQQMKVVSSQIPGIQTKILTGKSGVDAWSSQQIWDKVLFNVRVVAATHQVLLDALIHGFVRMRNISLIVFDEAHGCAKDHPGRRIMVEFYATAKENGDPHPSILGLTASPVQRKTLSGQEELERTLRAICVSPTKHRDVLTKHTKLPSTVKHVCGEENESRGYVAHNLVLLELLLFEGPEVARLSRKIVPHPGHPTIDKDTSKTLEFLKKFHRRAESIQSTLGPWAADFYVYKVIQKCKKDVGRADSAHKRPFLASLLRKVEASRPADPTTQHETARFLSGLSTKVKKLVGILSAYDGSKPRGIVFVKERPMAAVLAGLLSIHPLFRKTLRTGYIVGMSEMSTDRLDTVLYLKPDDSSKSLNQFRKQKLNILVATSVVEEGIDVPACNLVVCIDDVQNLKSYIQRRGRAREEGSQLHLLMSSNTPKSLAQEWEVLEKEMKRRYEDDERRLDDLQVLEARSRLDELIPPLVVPETQARMMARDAKQHLQRFCSTLSSSKFADNRLVFVPTQDEENENLVRRKVILPTTLPPHLRHAESMFAWETEADACADASFQAYKNLYEAGLVSSNLLPPRLPDDILDRVIEGRPGMRAVFEQINPWHKIARGWAALDSPQPLSTSGGAVPPSTVFRHPIRLLDGLGSLLCEADLLLPCKLPSLEQIRMFWDTQSKLPWRIEIGPGIETEYEPAGDHTIALLTAAYGYRWIISDSHRLLRIVCKDIELDKEGIGSLSFQPHMFRDWPSQSATSVSSFIRDPQGRPYFYQDYMQEKPPANLVRKPFKDYADAPEDVPYVSLRPLPKTVGFLHRLTSTEDVDEDDIEPNGFGTTSSAKPHHTVLPAEDCRVDNFPAIYTQFGALIPSLMPVLSVHLLAADLLSSTRLNELELKDRSLISTAISASVARLPTNYEYLEFIGDSTLKVCVSANCAAHNLYAPEGHLALFKDRLVSNSRLCRAAIDFGLDRYIVAAQSSLKKWNQLCKVTYVAPPSTGSGDGQMEDQDRPSASLEVRPEDERTMSTKTLADVVEAIVGAYMIDGGIDTALKCIELLLPDNKQWLSLEACQKTLFSEARSNSSWTPPEIVEELIGYTFKKKSILAEALTHASIPGLEDGACMERLEFLGDAVLDYIVGQKLFAVRPALTHQKMHLLRTTLVNAHFLGFAAMDFSITDTATDVAPDGTAQVLDKEIALWEFMRQGTSVQMASAQQAAKKRYQRLRVSILDGLWEGTAYPWALLTQLRPEKFFSDIVEAVIGAIWVDSGSVERVEEFLERIGLMAYFRRLLENDTHLMHPKEELGSITGNAKIRYKDPNKQEWTRAVPVEANLDSDDSDSSYVDDSDDDSDDDDNHNYFDDDDDDFLRDNGQNRTGGDDGGLADDGMKAYNDSKGKYVCCQLLINGQCRIQINDAATREEAETRAADFAVQAYKAGTLDVDYHMDVDADDAAN